jgi:RecB family exonuclease
MLPPSLSASAVNTFLGCEARYKAEWIDKTPDVGGSAANLGTTCHAALEEFVKNGQHLDGSPFRILELIYNKHYGRIFSDTARHKDGLVMLRRWYDRQDWSERTVLMVEQKMRFELPTSAGPIPFSYIFDRIDQLSNGDIEVVDYKTNVWTLAPEDLRGKVQAQVYAVAARLMYPDAERIWVTFDFLRGDPVGLSFSKEDNRKCWDFLVDTAERVIAADGSRERINAECRWCVRRHACNALGKHAVHGGAMSMEDPTKAADRRAELDAIRRAVDEQIAEIDTFIVDYMDKHDLETYATDDVVVSIAPRARRAVDLEKVAEILPPDLVGRYTSLSVTEFDKMLRDPDVTDEMKVELKKTVSRRYGKPSLRFKPTAIMPE